MDCLSTRIPTLLLGVTLLVALFGINRYLAQLDGREVIAVDQEHLARLDPEHQHRYRHYRAHGTAPEAAFQQVLIEWDRERLSLP